MVTLGRNLRVDLTLKVAAKAEQVTVTDEPPVIDIESSASFKNLRREDFDIVPKGRDFTSIVNLAPGANFEEKAGGVAVDGASGAENSYVLDGLDTTNLEIPLPEPAGGPAGDEVHLLRPPGTGTNRLRTR